MKVFRDTDAVLRWAYAMPQQPICKVSDAQRAMAGASATNKSADGDLSIQDQHAQAAMILHHIYELRGWKLVSGERIPGLLCAYAWASYSWSDEERRKGNRVLDDHFATVTGIRNNRMRFLLMRRSIEFGQERCMSCERIAEKIGVHKRTIQRYEPAMKASMQAVTTRFFDELDPYFARAGLIRP